MTMEFQAKSGLTCTVMLQRNYCPICPMVFQEAEYSGDFYIWKQDGSNADCKGDDCSIKIQVVNVWSAY